ncbi:hypothetical protein SAMN05421852_101441 [Thermoflavimicrobium dichotomicum]|uniref:Uncharacterized protein n=1 Tax=Thermoflavimicrobium dichotomicum TaxID=46223 RepID=A0A1I3KFL8_9BACL|nr:hypothetical protein SAMN05421852_101441 [Thermoflavimicrobium dichotomicum]
MYQEHEQKQKTKRNFYNVIYVLIESILCFAYAYAFINIQSYHWYKCDIGINYNANLLTLLFLVGPVFVVGAIIATNIIRSQGKKKLGKEGFQLFLFVLSCQFILFILVSFIPVLDTFSCVPPSMLKG